MQYSADVANSITAALTPRRLGILGGTFDPVHNAHMAMAYIAMDDFALESIVFMPTGKPPHKQGRSIATAEHRYNMLLYACEDLRFTVSRIELEREGYTYTVDTLRQLSNQYPEGTEFFFIVGSDTLKEIPTWKDSGKVVGMCAFIAFVREGTDMEEVEAHADYLRSMGGRVLLSRRAIPGISSTPIRALAAEGQPLDAYLPAAVEDYIKKYRVYE